jgi:hypothetical protein
VASISLLLRAPVISIARNADWVERETSLVNPHSRIERDLFVLEVNILVQERLALY